jgi:hypothetical protein
MDQVYVVCWSSAGQDDDGNSKAYCGVHGVYAFQDDAKRGLEACKDEIYSEIVDNPDYDEEDREEVKASTHVYGSVNDDYFEIDYELGGVPSEIYIKIEVKNIMK